MSLERRKVTRIVIPTVNGKLCAHFEHSQQFTLFNVEDGEAKNVEAARPPPHAPGVLPKWLREQGADIIIASGMGRRAQTLFSGNGISVVGGAPVLELEVLVKQYFNGELELGSNICDH
jgi:ATP-binding protein involved in chromosome partitioning